MPMRLYTQKQVRPVLNYQADTFLPQSIPAFAATELMNKMKEKYPDYHYKEAVLNPTNPRDLADTWESAIVERFRNGAASKEVSGIRDTPLGPAVYMARPLQIKEEGCLLCHSTPDRAPPAMLKIYGEKNGFGWQLNEIIGAQVVSVPMSLPVANANRAFATFMASLTIVFVVLFVILNIMLSLLIVRPITKMSESADAISTGNMSMGEFDDSGKDEVALLAKSFNRMRRSLAKAISLIDE
jgi:HAMP domain-containing protein